RLLRSSFLHSFPFSFPYFLFSHKNWFCWIALISLLSSSAVLRLLLLTSSHHWSWCCHRMTIDGGWFGSSPAASWIQLQYEGAGDIFFPKHANQTHCRYFCARQLNTSFTSPTAATFFNSNYSWYLLEVI
uniref:Uncharacterized protein n=1 Tax=Aegilops tauschii subsp. strangulata TaxID=200361 RepID=A0A453NV17_AEGTS